MVVNCIHADDMRERLALHSRLGQEVGTEVGYTAHSAVSLACGTQKEHHYHLLAGKSAKSYLHHP